MPKTVMESLKGQPYEEFMGPDLFLRFMASFIDLAKLIDKKKGIEPKIDTGEPKLDKNGNPQLSLITGQPITKKIPNPESFETQINQFQTEMDEYIVEIEDLQKRVYGRGNRNDLPSMNYKVIKNPDEFDKKLTTFLNKARNIYEDFINNADEDTLAFKPYFDTMAKPLYYDKGKFSRALIDSQYLAPIYAVLGGGPKLSLSVKELREGLDDSYVPENKAENNEIKNEKKSSEAPKENKESDVPENKDVQKEEKPLKYLNEYYSSYLNLVDLEYDKQELTDKSYTPEEEAEYLQKLKKGMQRMVDAHDKLLDFEKKHYRKYNQTYLNNELFNMVDYARDDRAAMYHIKGQMQAIDNGWGVKDLGMLGILVELDKGLECSKTELEKELKIKKKTQSSNPNDIEKLEKELAFTNSVIEKYAPLKEELWNKKITCAADKKEVYDKFRIFLNENRKCEAVATVSKRAENELSYISASIREQFYKEDYKKDWDEKKIPEEYGLCSRQLATFLDFYKPVPKFHPEWEKNGVMKEADFHQSFAPYDSKNLPFNDMEMAFIAAGATLTFSPEMKEMLEKERPDLGIVDQDVIDGNCTLWISDAFAKEEGPREAFGTKKEIIQYGRIEGKKIAEAYAGGDVKPLAEMIQNAFRIGNQVSRTMGLLGDVTAVSDYAMYKTYLDLLEKDPKLLEEYNKINESKPEYEKADIEGIKNMTAVNKLLMAGASAEKEKSIYSGISEERKAELDKNIVRSNLLKLIFKEEKKENLLLPEYCEELLSFKEKNNLIMAQDSVRATLNEASFMRSHNPKMKFFDYFGSEEGKTDLEIFQKHISEKYGMAKLTTGTDSNLLIEIQKFNYDSMSKQYLKELDNATEMTAERKLFLAGKITRYNYLSEQCQEIIEGRKADSLLCIKESDVEEAFKKSSTYDALVTDYFKNQDITQNPPKAIADMLRSGHMKLITDNISAAAEIKEVQEKKTFAVLDQSIEALHGGNKGTWFGKGDYDKVIKDLEALNKMIKTADREIVKKGTYSNYEQILQKAAVVQAEMKAYRTRKETEFAKDDADGYYHNNNSQRRYDIMGNALKSLTHVMEQQRHLHECADKAKLYNEYAESRREYNAAVAKDIKERSIGSVDEMLSLEAEARKGLSEVMSNLSKQSDTAVDPDKIAKIEANRKSTVQAGIKSTLNSIYLQLLKDEYGNKGSSDPEKALDNERKLHIALGSGYNANLNVFSKIIKSGIGEQFTKNVIKNLKENKCSHEDAIQLRDSTIKECFAKYKADYDTAKKNGKQTDMKNASDRIQEVFKISKALGSDVLKPYSKMINQEAQKKNEFKLSTDVSKGKAK